MIEQKLEIVRKFQHRFPTCHVGGSIGLFLRGVDLKRSLDKSDIDLTVSESIDFSQPLDIENAEESSNPEDFDYQFRYYPNVTGVYTKVDINVLPQKQFDVIVYEGNQYRVSKTEDIYFYKSKYAVKGVEKHIDDFITIVTGVRPERKEELEAVKYTDDLPF